MKRLIFLAAFFAIILNFQNVNACSCNPPDPPLKSLEQAGAVFSGRVVRIDYPLTALIDIDPVKVTFAVSRVWKGQGSGTVEVFTAGGGASCGYGFENGKEYIVYADLDGYSLHTGLCSRTALLENAQEDLAALGEGTEMPGEWDMAGRPPIEFDSIQTLFLGGLAVLIFFAIFICSKK